MSQLVDALSGTDRISQLPDEILHQILRRLDASEAAQTTVLSKSWRHLWALRESCSCLEIDQHEVIPYPIPMFSSLSDEEREIFGEKFIKHIDDSIQPLIEKKLYVPKLSIRVEYYVSTLCPHIDRCLDLAIKAGVQVIDIDIEFLLHLELWGRGREIFYTLPPNVLATKSLTYLRLCKCQLEIPPNMKLPHLRELHLIHLDVSDHEVQNLLTSCQSIENLTLSSCNGMKMKNLHLSGHSKLSRVSLSYCKRLKKVRLFCLSKLSRVNLSLCQVLEKVQIEAASLRTFEYYACANPCEVILDACKKLESLNLINSWLTDEQFQGLFSKFSELQNLSLKYCRMLRSIKIASPQLRKLTLECCTNLEEVEIDTPNLNWLMYEGDKVPFSSMDPSSIREAEFLFTPAHRYNPELWFDIDTVSASRFLQKFNNSENLVLIVLSEKKILVYEDLTEIYLPQGKELKLEITGVSNLSNLMCGKPDVISILPSSSQKWLKSIRKGINFCKDQHRLQSFREATYIDDYSMAEEGEASNWFGWLNSVPLLRQRISFLVKWD